MPPSKPFVTQYDIAAKLGIGQKTVSRALSGDPTVAAELSERILTASRKLGYRPNQSARSVRSRRFDNILLLQIVGRAHHRLVPGLIDGVSDELGKHGLSLTMQRLVVTEFSAGGPIPRGLQEVMVDGMLVHVDAEPSPEIERLVRDSGVPVVWINRLKNSDAARPDDAHAGRLMAERLLRAGHRQIAWFDGVLAWPGAEAVHYSRHERWSGFQAACNEAGVIARLLSPTQEVPDLGEWLADNLRSAMPTALATYGEREALTALYAATSHLRVRVPTDLSLITAHHQSLMAGIRIEVCRIPTVETGAAAARLLVQRLAGKKSCPSQVIPGDIVPGASITPVGT